MFFSFVLTQIFLQPWEYPSCHCPEFFEVGMVKTKVLSNVHCFYWSCLAPFLCDFSSFTLKSPAGICSVCKLTISSLSPHYLVFPVSSELNGYTTTVVCLLCCFHCVEKNFWHLNCCVFCQCQSSCTSPEFIPQWALKCSKLHMTQVSCSKRSMTNVPVQDVWFSAHTGLVPASATVPYLAAWGIQPYPSCSLESSTQWSIKYYYTLLVDLRSSGTCWIIKWDRWARITNEIYNACGYVSVPKTMWP